MEIGKQKDTAAACNWGGQRLMHSGISAITFRTTRCPTPRLKGFLDANRAVLAGIFNPNNKEEVKNCKALLANPDLNDTIVAVVVGNETLTFRRGTLDDIEAVIKELKSLRAIPCTTTEIIQSYGSSRLLDLGDFVLVNVHGIFAGKLQPAACAKWTTAQIAGLLGEERAKGRVLLIREIGYPSAPDPFTDDQQHLFWTTVLEDDVAQRTNIFFFEGLKNAGWKHERISVPGTGDVDVGPHWPVLFDVDGNPKPLCPSGKSV
jgi:exo-beta-1,3-glucanase (GH17 family)